MGPWVPSVAVSYQLQIRSFITHHVVLNLGFTLTILHVVLDLIILHVVLGLLLGTFSARLVLSPCSFTLLVVLGASCLRTLVQKRLSRAARGLVVSSTTTLLPSARCACRALSPELGCSGRRLTKQLHVSLSLKTASSLSGLLSSATAWSAEVFNPTV